MVNIILGDLAAIGEPLKSTQRDPAGSALGRHSVTER
jgi:hypothetical protein